MRILIQRVLSANVSVDNSLVGAIQRGMLLLVGFTQTDNPEIIKRFADKILKLRIWDSLDGKSRWHTNVAQNKFEILVVSQFTLYHILKGNKPDFHKALENEKALAFYEMFVEILKQRYMKEKIQIGAFGKYMNVSMVGDGPVTITMDSGKDQPSNEEESNIEKEEKNVKDNEEIKEITK